VSVVIPVRNSAATVAAAVASALAQDYPGPLEVVLAEGRSSDTSRAVIEALAAEEPRVRVVVNPTGLTPCGLNAAIQASTGQVIVRCDAHAELPPGYIAAAVATLEATGAGVVGGVQDAVGVTPFERAVAYAMANLLGSGGAAYRSVGEAGEVDTVYLGVFRRSALAAVGLYDESLQRNQDYDLNRRIAASGRLVFFAPGLRVRYRPRGSLGALWRQYHAYGRWKRLVLRRSPSTGRVRQLAAPALVAGLILSGALMATPWTSFGLVVPLLYVAAVLAAAVFEAVRHRDLAGLVVGAALPTMHLAWGTGFWRAGLHDPGPQVPRLVNP